MNRKIKAMGIAVCVLLVTAGAVLPVERTLNVDRDIITEQMTIGKTDSLARLGEISRYFTKNCGQINAEAVKYYIQDSGVWLLDDSVAFYIREPHEVSNAQGYPELKSEFGGETGEAVGDGVVLKVNYEGANHVDPKGQDILPHRSNFFYGENSIEWRSGVPNYQEVVYPNIYDNIDLIFQDSQRGLKYSFVVHPGGNPSDIRMRYEGIEKLDIDSSGNLTIRTSIGVLTDSELFIYQHTDQDENEVEGRFTIIDSTTYGFEISECYDKDKDLFIDPLIYSTLLGGEDKEEGYGIAVDESGKVYVTGYTSSVDFPTTVGAYDTTYNGPWRNVFVFKLNPDSTISPNEQLIYSTYIGAQWKDSVGWGITVDSVGNAYVTGKWGGSIFVLKLNPNGNVLVYKRHYGTGCGRDIIFKSTRPIHNRAYVKSKADEHLYVTGYASSLSTTKGSYQSKNKGSKDAFVLKLDPANGDTFYGSCFGGSGFDRGFGIAVDGSGKVYVTGETYSDNFPVEPEGYVYQESKKGGCDAFVFILQPQGNGASDLFYSSYLGGNMKDWGNGIALRSWGSAVEVYITGITESYDFPTTPNAYDKTYNGGYQPNMLGDVFVVKLVPSPTMPGDEDLTYSTYIGGCGRDEGFDIVVDSAGDAYVTGYAMVDFPVTQNAFDGSYNGAPSDVFVLRLRTVTPPPFSLLSPKLKYSTYIGGESGEEGRAISFGPDGVYITGGTWQQSVFPTTSGAYQTTQKGNNDVFVVITKCPTTSSFAPIELVPI
jgi:hypothetical protein